MSENPSPTLNSPEEKQDFTTSMQALEGILDTFKAGTLNLEDSLTLFEKGIQHLKVCQEKLTHARGRVDELVKTMQASGEAVTQPFELES